MTNNTRAIALMTGAMASFAAVDAFVKLASRTQSAAQIMGLTSVGVLIVFLVVMRRNGERLFTARALNPILLIRVVGEVIGSFGIIMALAAVPLSEVTVLGQAQPLVVIMGAAFFLGEKVGPRRWIAVCLGMTGVLIIMRPGFGAFNPNHLWVLAYIFGLAARDISSRVLPDDMSNSFAIAWSMLALSLFGIALMPFQGGWHPIDGVTAVWLLCIVATASLALALITASFRSGEISAVAPFRYTRILFALGLAWLVFGEKLDAIGWAGLALIVGSGLYSFWRERQLASV